RHRPPAERDLLGAEHLRVPAHLAESGVVGHPVHGLLALGYGVVRHQSSRPGSWDSPSSSSSSVPSPCSSAVADTEPEVPPWQWVWTSSCASSRASPVAGT